MLQDFFFFPPNIGHWISFPGCGEDGGYTRAHWDGPCFVTGRQLCVGHFQLSFVGSTHIDHWPQSFCSLTFRLLSRSPPLPPPPPHLVSALLICCVLLSISTPFLIFPSAGLSGETLHCKPRLTQNVNYSPEGVSTTRSWRKQTSRGADGKTLRDETSRHWDGTQRLRVALWPVLQG